MGQPFSTCCPPRDTVECCRGDSICVAVKHGLVIASDYENMQLRVYSLVYGTLMRTIGSKGEGRGEFMFSSGGLCVSADGESVLVAEMQNGRVQQVRISDGSWMRFIGRLWDPQFVDCNDAVIVVSEECNNRINVFSWRDGGLMAQFGTEGTNPGELDMPRGIRLLGDGNILVADCYNNRLCVFSLSGEFVGAWKAHCVSGPFDVFEVDSSFIATDMSGSRMVTISRDGLFNRGSA